MNTKRVLGFGLIMWILIFVIWSIIMFIPFLQDRLMTQYVIYWILLVPVTLLSAKWYFKEDSPTLKKGLLLGLIGLAVGIVLDLIITVPLFIKSYSEFYSQWELYVGFAIFLLVCMYAGFEFDATYTKDKSVKEVEKEEDLTEE